MPADPTAQEPPAAREATGDEDRAGEDRPQTQQALSFVLRSTGNRPQSEAEVAAKLRSRGYGEDVVEETLTLARGYGAVDDAAFAAAWVEDRGWHRGFGVARLRRELRERQIPEALVDEALAALDSRDELAVATEVARERVRQLPASLTTDAIARRLYGYLGRRGYPEALAQRVALSVSGLDRDRD